MIYRRFFESALWCREIAIPLAVLVVLATASAPAHNVYSFAAADVTPVAVEMAAGASNIPLPDGPATTVRIATAASAADALDAAALRSEPPKADAPPTDAFKVAALNVDVPKLDAPSADAKTIDAKTVDDATNADAQTIDATSADAMTTNALASNGPVLAALEIPDEKLSRPSLETATQPNNVAGPKTDEIYDAANAIEIHDECLVLDICVDRYLWQLYQKTKKEDSIKESTEKKVTVKKKGKTVTVTRTTTIVIDEDFGWKDPKAAKNVGMSLADYVIGGVDRNFKLRLFAMLHAAEQAGLSPGITSGFRDDYRQSIASGLKAASNRSYHGGSLRGGYGHGVAADIVSTKGGSRAERLANSDVLWKWVDNHGRDFGLGRPYLDRDPPHVAPTDGEEFARKRPGAATRQAAAQAK